MTKSEEILSGLAGRLGVDMKEPFEGAKPSNADDAKDALVPWVYLRGLSFLPIKTRAMAVMAARRVRGPGDERGEMIQRRLEAASTPEELKDAAEAFRRWLGEIGELAAPPSNDPPTV